MAVTGESIHSIVQDISEQVAEKLGRQVGETVERCLTDMLTRTVTHLPDGTAFVITGDIPAMWLRDSTAQLAPFLHLAHQHSDLADLIAAVSRRQLDYVLHDPYANAFNVSNNAAGHRDVFPQSPWVWERKYEIDSLAYTIQLAYDLWTTTSRTDHLQSFVDVAKIVIHTWRTEQDHERNSTYRFARLDCPQSDTLTRDGLGPVTGHTGMTWAGFRPSDDACVYGYNIPGNAFAAIALRYVAELAVEVFGDHALAQDADLLRQDIEQGIENFGLMKFDGRESVYAYEVDGLGNSFLADDANVPSLLSLPMLGWCAATDPIYKATRSRILSEANPYFYAGAVASGIGSPHTPPDQIWPIALAVQGLTSDDPGEKRDLLALLLATDGGTGLMHESFHVDDPTKFTRPWFSWANAMFCELALDVAGLRNYQRPTVRS
ncbi:glycoside hydrolase family 125 protein [Devosia sp.]|uniref:glycoside hydrolase family 125 protein n=1 Tax=Devosia sp. TaxID=1871048 RepID=UPI001AC30DD1|nr:glycoside hydrolase family 125 protein [Devosia sp.]MBN9334261.1 glycoside hydrolase family 125 protein [Devosia sp.]